jgi:hypothetical protein
MSPLDPEAVLRRARPISAGRPPRDAPALVGVDAGGLPVRLPVSTAEGGAPWTLLLFVKTDCLGCGPLWELVRSPEQMGTDARVRVLAAVHDVEDPVEVARLAGPGGVVVTGDVNWTAYGVHGPSFFVLVEGASARVATEGVVWDAAQVVSAVLQHAAGGGG